MPQRSSRNNNNNHYNGRNSNKRTTDSQSQIPPHQSHRTSPPPSPPTHLPTPLPDEQLLSLRASAMEDSLTELGLGVGDAAAPPTRHVESETGVDVDGGDDASIAVSTFSLSLGHAAAHPTRLIDLDTPPPAQLIALPERADDPDAEEEVKDQADVDALGLDSSYTYQAAMAYRSPPFREAQLPEKQDSPPPLPIPHRVPQQEFGEDEEGEGGFVGELNTSRNATIRMPRVMSPTHRPSLSTPNVSSPSNASSSRPTTTSILPSSPALQSRSRFGGFDAFSIGQALRSSYASLHRLPVVGYGVFSSSSSATASRAAASSSSGQPQQHRRVVSQQEFERDYERYDDSYNYGYRQPEPQMLQPQPQPQQSQPRLEEEYEYDTSRYPQQQRQQQGVAADMRRLPQPQRQRIQGQESGLAMAMKRGSPTGGYTSYSDSAEPMGPSGPEAAPSRGMRHEEKERDRGRREAEVISWARWDVLNDRRVLIIAYPTSLQIWDCADLKEVKEVLDVDFGAPEWGLLVGDSSFGPRRRGKEEEEGGKVRMRVVHAAVLPPPKILPAPGKATRVDDVDGFRDVRPLLAILMEPANEDERELETSSTTLVLYSLRKHQIVKMLSLDGRAMPTGIGKEGFVANEFVVAIGTTNPPRIHILSTLTFHTLHIVHSDALEPFYRPTAVSYSAQQSISSTLGVPSALSPSTSNSSQPSMASTGLLSIEGVTAGTTPPHLMYCLILSFRYRTGYLPMPLLRPGHHHHQARMRAVDFLLRPMPHPHPGLPPLMVAPRAVSLRLLLAVLLTGMSTITQADVGHAALKVGESVLGGMRFLGGPVSVGYALGVEGGGSGRGRLVSRRMRRDRDRRYSAGTPTTPTTTTAAPQTRQVAEHGYYVTVLDLAPLFSFDPARDPRLSPASVSSSRSASRSPHAPGPPAPRKVDEFLVSRSQPVAGLSFSKDGTSVGVVPRDGHSVKVFKLHPAPGVMVAAYNVISSSSALASSQEDTTPREFSERQIPEPMTRPASQLYDLYRGRTSAVIESVDWSRDGKWVGIGTRNRTVHVFGVNPFGMKPDVVWHLGGRVRDGVVSGVEPRTTQMTPLVRVRASKSSSSAKNIPSSIASTGSSSPAAVYTEPSRAPLAFTFVPPSELSANIQTPNSPRHHPVPSSSFSPSMSPSSPTFSSASPSVHGHSGSRPSLSRQQTSSSPHQDILLFDPADGVLSLRRLILDKHPVKEGGISTAIGGIGGSVGAAAAHALGVTSISLPGMGGAGKLSSSPSLKVSVGGGRDVKKDVGSDSDMELGAKESTVVWWDLRSGRESRGQVKFVFEPLDLGSKGKGRTVISADWLAQGEISTCSSSEVVLPRSLYLSHQFSFHTLGEDYHALIRRYQFDINGDKIEVRKEVEVVSAFSPSSAGAGVGLPGGGADAFMQDFDAQPHHRHARRISSSFDEPIASAISGSLQVDSANLPLILPMYPNGVPGSATGPAFAFPHKVLRNAIPIGKGIGRNVNVVGEGIGRIVSAGVGRRGRERERDREGGFSLNDEHGELHVPLEFDEEDEDFIRGERPGSSGPLAATSESSRDTSLVTPGNSSVAHSLMMDADVVGRVDEEIWGDDLASVIPHPSTSASAGVRHRHEGSLEDDSDFVRGWDKQDRLAVEEQEGYDDLGIVGVGGRVQRDVESEAERDKDKERKRKSKTRKR
ncbi:hypothetical protein CPB84DRAFT_1773819 [Gymnopilus junonius]|uniref:BCAS3 WD40 domain-containing protein n=1 Tax=Gymnopilus junonius TaxID=109634 RepID=A0A9P5TPY7_GYMJU|nr:hypothetical protein CPB84DRAFT_1773819 [Gymnopilus junonius]